MNQGVDQGVNRIEPDLILIQELTRRLAAYLDWDNYYALNVDRYINTTKIELEIALNPKKKWGFARFVLFPLSHASAVLDVKVGTGFDLTRAF